MIYLKIHNGYTYTIPTLRVIIKMEKDNNYINKILKGMLNSSCLLLHADLQQNVEGKAL